MSQNKRWVLLENNEPHTVLLTLIEASKLIIKLRIENPLKDYKVFFDEYYEYIEYYSDEEKEQINRLIP
jgi:hypothetical protein